MGRIGKRIWSPTYNNYIWDIVLVNTILRNSWFFISRTVKTQKMNCTTFLDLCLDSLFSESTSRQGFLHGLVGFPSHHLIFIIEALSHLSIEGWLCEIFTQPT
eukprot:TRINITY_DN12005_c0_g4_i3.p1 TRINITY_DN12005_c0_g4~~TRINITY_DN12005_c0_g4_i3.p1  ORF type:complete len:103 (-),score=1.83 TRINITY_DN12005_c0_g4_i3:425-733(-)